MIQFSFPLTSRAFEGLLAAFLVSTFLFAALKLMFVAIPAIGAGWRYRLVFGALMLVLLTGICVSALPSAASRTVPTSPANVPSGRTLDSAEATITTHASGHAATVSPTTEPRRARAVFAVSSKVSALVVFAWALCASLLLGRLLYGVWRLARSKRTAKGFSAEQIDPEFAGLDVRVSPEVKLPAAAGFGSRVVLLPCQLVDQLGAEDMRNVLLHESAHLARHDDVTLLLERFVECLLFFSPAVRWASHELSISREMACDEWALRRSAGSVGYMRSIVRVAEFFAGPNALPAPGMSSSVRDLDRRLNHIMRPATVRATMTMRVACAIGASCLIVAAPVSARQKLLTVATTGSAWSRVVAAADLSNSSVMGTFLLVRKGHRFVELHLDYANSVDSTITTDAQSIRLNVTPESSKATFVLQREAGSIAGTGDVNAARIVGTFVFHPNERFTDTLRRQGVTTGEENTRFDELRAAMFDLSNEYAHDVSSAGLSGISFSDLLALRMMAIPPYYVRMVANSGIQPFDAQAVLRLHIQQIQPEYAQSMVRLLHPCCEPLSADDIIDLRFHQIDPSYVEALIAHGVRVRSIKQLIELKKSER